MVITITIKSVLSAKTVISVTHQHIVLNVTKRMDFFIIKNVLIYAQKEHIKTLKNLMIKNVVLVTQTVNNVMVLTFMNVILAKRIILSIMANHQKLVLIHVLESFILILLYLNVNFVILHVWHVQEQQIFNVKHVIKVMVWL